MSSIRSMKSLWRKSLACLSTFLFLPLAAASPPPANLLAAPASPVNVSATWTSDQYVTIKWTDNSTNELNFPMRFKSSTGNWTLIGWYGSDSETTTGKVYSFKHAAPERRAYCYQISAVRGAEQSAWSQQACAAPAVMNQHQIVPAYFSPDWGNASGRWQTMCKSMNRVGGYSVAIMNPYGGPSAAAERDAYKEVIRGCHSFGHRVIGYVSTDWARPGGLRPLSLVLADIDAYYYYYKNNFLGFGGIDGIFVDEMSNSPGDPAFGRPTVQEYYQAIYNHIKNKTWRNELVVGNPGAPAATPWQVDFPTRVADNVVVFEGVPSGPSGHRDFIPPDWVKLRDPNAFSQIVYSTPPARRATVCGDSKMDNVGFLYVTDDVPSNPFDELPSYWLQEAPICN